MLNRKLFDVPGRADRRVAVVLLVLANMPAPFVMIVLFWIAATATPLPGWLELVIAGGITGQALALAYWLSLSADTLWFRLSVLLTTVLGFTVSVGVSGLLLQLQLYYQQPSPRVHDIVWTEFVERFLVQVVSVCLMALAMFSFAYAVFVPIRRLRGYSLSTATAFAEQAAGRRQFQIYEWMIWTCIVATPLVLVRIVTYMGNMESEATYLFGFVMLFAITPLVVGWPMFCSGLAERRPLVWCVATFAAYAALGWLACETAYWINIDRLTQQPGLLSGLFSFWPFETFGLSVAVGLALNSLALRWLGFRLRRMSHEIGIPCESANAADAPARPAP